MKQLIAVFFLLGLLIACSKDDVCTNDQFLGKWNGEIVCEGLTTRTETITLTLATDNKKIFINGGDFKNEVLTRNDCVLEGGEVILGVGNVITGTLSNGDKNLTLTVEFKGGGGSAKCIYNLSR